MFADINGDALKLLELFIDYALSPSTADGVADALYYDRDELQRRARLLKEQLTK